LCKGGWKASSLDILSQEDKVFSGTLLLGRAVSSAKVSNEGAERLLLMVKNAENAVTLPKPVLFSKGAAYRPKDSRNLVDLTSKLQEKPKITTPDGVGKTFSL
jgi:hypothetical protein